MSQEWATALLTVVLVVASFVAGFRKGVVSTAFPEIQQALRRAQLTTADAILYRRAAAILNRLVRATGLEGDPDFPVDVLTPTSRDRVEQWLADYREELDRK